MLNALSEAHGLGLVHRDLKPDNIMLVVGPWGEEQAKVLDFGIAKVRSKEKETLETGTGLLLGTPLYMPPEQAMARGAEPRSDLYSLGVVLYEMLTGGPPFTAATVFEVLLAHRERPVPAFPPECQVPPKLEEAIIKAMAKEPEQRFADAAEMATALSEAVPTAGAGAEGGAGVSQGTAPVAAGAMLRTPLPVGARQSKPGLLNAHTAVPSTPLPANLKRSGTINPSSALRARQSAPGVQPVDPNSELAATHTPLPSQRVPVAPSETAGTMMKSTGTTKPVTPKPKPNGQTGAKAAAPKPKPATGSRPPVPAAEPSSGGGGMAVAFGIVGLLVLMLGGGGAWYYFTHIKAAHSIPDPDPIAKSDKPVPDKPVVPDKPTPDKPIAGPDKPVKPDEPTKPPEKVAEAGPDASVPEKVAVKDPEDDPKPKNPKNPNPNPNPNPAHPKNPKNPPGPNPNPKPKGSVEEKGYKVPEL